MVDHGSSQLLRAVFPPSGGPVPTSLETLARDLSRTLDYADLGDGEPPITPARGSTELRDALLGDIP